MASSINFLSPLFLGIILDRFVLAPLEYLWLYPCPPFWLRVTRCAPHSVSLRASDCVYNRYGPRACSCVSMGCVTAGFLVFGASSHDMGYMIGLSLISFGGPGVQNAIIHLSNLFPASKSTIISIITGCFQVLL